MSPLDWLILLLPLPLLFLISLATRRYITGVADFLTGRRAAGRYLVCVSQGTASMGLVSAVAFFEMFYQAGTAINWWGNLYLPASLMVALTGFVVYRYRETRVMTMAQFFEVRYSRKFRIFMGVLAVLSGVVNYGIFPAVNAHFFIYYCHLPRVLHVGPLATPTFPLLLALFLSLALCMVLLGGQLQQMLADCLEGVLSGILFIIVAAAILYEFSFHQMYVAMASAPPGRSLLNPFDTGHMRNFNIYYVLIGVIAGVYTVMSWQGNQGFNAAPANPHEAKMANILGNWRGLTRNLVFTLLALAAVTYMKNPAFAPQAAVVRAQLHGIANPTLRVQETVPVALSHLLPAGVKGCFAAMMFLMMLAVDISYLHSWGSIFVQDVVLPLRREPLRPTTHLHLLRGSITGVAVFAFFFSLLFRQTQYIFMFFAITGAIYLGGSGAVIIGGLYWRRGTTAAAWATMGIGSSVAVFGIVAPYIWPAFPINGQYMFGLAMGGSCVTYVALSLATGRRHETARRLNKASRASGVPFNMERMLHRGVYARSEDMVQAQAKAGLAGWKRILLGFDEHFTRGDKIISAGFFGWSMFFFAGFVVITLINLVHPWPDRLWWQWGLVGIYLAIILTPLTTIWFTWGALRDLRRFFQTLRVRRVDERDDGRVIGHRNADEVPASGGADAPAAPPAPAARESTTHA